MVSRKATTSDDRGRPVPILGSASVTDDPELAAAVRRVVETTVGLNQPVRLGHLLLILAGLIYVTSLSFLPSLLPGLPTWAVGFVFLPPFVVVGWLVMNASRHRHAKRYEESLLRIGRCPSCGYRLENLPPELDGAVVCPECSAAWAQSRIHFVPVPEGELPPTPDSVADARPLGKSWVRSWTRLPSIVDDRNRSVPMVDLSLRALDPAMDPERARRIRTMLRHRGEVRRFGCAGLLVLFVAFYGVTQVMSFSRSGWAGVSGFGLIAVAFLVPTWLIGAWRIWSGRSWVGQKAALSCLRECRVCPSCAGDLAALHAEPDGCTVCPRCFAAWKVRL